ncbi:hypothetical protein BDW69DRAFT_87782 [Aspergillus filifer]
MSWSKLLYWHTSLAHKPTGFIWVALGLYLRASRFQSFLIITSKDICNPSNTKFHPSDLITNYKQTTQQQWVLCGLSTLVADTPVSTLLLRYNILLFIHQKLTETRWWCSRRQARCPSRPLQNLLRSLQLLPLSKPNYILDENIPDDVMIFTIRYSADLNLDINDSTFLSCLKGENGDIDGA